MTATPSPEITPALDETRPIIGPNLAANEELCRAVAGYVRRHFAYPYMLQQQRLNRVWDRIDDAWRVKGKSWDLDITATDPIRQITNADGKGQGVTSREDGVSAKVYPAAMHRQIRNKTDMHMSIAWADGLPVRAQVPETLYEHHLYNPTAQSAAAANELLQQCSDAVTMKPRDRLVRGSWCKYGHTWVFADFKYRLVDMPVVYTIPQDPQMAMMMVQQVAAMFQNQPPTIGQDQYGNRTATWIRRTVDADSMVTDFVPLRHDAVFVDQTLSAADLDRQPCPIIRSHVTNFDLWGNDYEPQLNPFGWLNVRQAQSKQGHHYTAGDPSEKPWRDELAKKYQLSDTGLVRPENSLKQLWTCYPLLAIDPQTGLLDEGEGINCPTCNGMKTVEHTVIQGGAPMQVSTLPGMTPDSLSPGYLSVNDNISVAHVRDTCPDCQGEGRKYIEPKRYVVQMFGQLMAGEGSVTVLRIQPNPTVKNRVPLLFGAHLTEDTAGAIPLCVAEAALPSGDQLATAHNQFLDGKNQVINRQWEVQEDEACIKMDLNRPNRNIPVSQIGNARPAQSVGFDVTTTLPGYISMQENEVQQNIGLPDTLLGLVSSGRRAATEIQTASDAAKLPITVEIDSCNTQIHGRWAQWHLDNIEAYADRDWILKRTGRESFGRVKLHTQVAEDFFTKQAQMQLLQNFLPIGANIPGFNTARAAQEIFSLAGFNNVTEFIDDGGQRKAIMDGFKIVAKILGEGIFVPPNPWDPHAIFIELFQQAMEDPEWQERTPENMPLLQQRLIMQSQLQAQQQMQQMQLQMQQQAMLMPPGGNGGNAPRGGNIPGNPTQAAQAQAGRNAPQTNQ